MESATTRKFTRRVNGDGTAHCVLLAELREKSAKLFGLERLRKIHFHAFQTRSRHCCTHESLPGMNTFLKPVIPTSNILSIRPRVERPRCISVRRKNGRQYI